MVGGPRDPTRAARHELLVARLDAAGALDPAFGGGDGVVQSARASRTARSYDLALEAGGERPRRRRRRRPDASTTGPTPVPGAPVRRPARAPRCRSPASPPTASPSAQRRRRRCPTGGIAVAGWGAVDRRAARASARRRGCSPTGAPDTTFSGDGWDARSPSAATRGPCELDVDADGRITVAGVGDLGALRRRPRRSRRASSRAAAPDAGFSGDGQLVVGYPDAVRRHEPLHRRSSRAATRLLAAGLARRRRPGRAAADHGRRGAHRRLRHDGRARRRGRSGPARARRCAVTSAGGAVVAGRTGGDVAPDRLADPVAARRTRPPAASARTASELLRGRAARRRRARRRRPARRGRHDRDRRQGVVARFAPERRAGRGARARPPSCARARPRRSPRPGSSDPEGETLRYAFDLDGNGSFEFDGGENPLALRSFAAPGTYTVGVRVTDPRGGTATAQRADRRRAPARAVPQPRARRSRASRGPCAGSSATACPAASGSCG